MKNIILLLALMLNYSFSRTLFASMSEAASTGGFIADTKVFTINAEDDYVRSHSAMTGTKILSGLGKDKQVSIVNTYYREVDKVLRINSEGDSITVAENQWIFSPFSSDCSKYDEKIHWKQAKDLEIGDYIYSHVKKDMITIDEIEIFEEGIYEIYHIELDQDHVFFAGDLGIMVHNPHMGNLVRLPTKPTIGIVPKFLPLKIDPSKIPGGPVYAAKKKEEEKTPVGGGGDSGSGTGYANGFWSWVKTCVTGGVTGGTIAAISSGGPGVGAGAALGCVGNCAQRGAEIAFDKISDKISPPTPAPTQPTNK